VAVLVIRLPQLPGWSVVVGDDFSQTPGFIPGYHRMNENVTEVDNTCNSEPQNSQLTKLGQWVMVHK